MHANMVDLCIIRARGGTKETTLQRQSRHSMLFAFCIWSEFTDIPSGCSFTGLLLTVTEAVRIFEDLKTQRQQLIIGNTCSEFRCIKEPRFWIVYLFWHRIKELRWSLKKDILNTICSPDDWWRYARLIISLNKIRFEVSPIMEASANHWFFYLFFFSFVLMDTSVWWTHFPTCGSLRTAFANSLGNEWETAFSFYL